MAPATRRASAAAASAAASGPCRLLALSDDEVSAVAHELCDPLRPLLAVNLSSTAKGLRVAMQPALAELRLQRQAAVALAALCGRSPAGLRDTRELCLGPNHGKPLSLAHWRTLGNLIGCRSLLRLESLAIHEGVALLAAGLRRGGMPSLTRLVLYKAQIGDHRAPPPSPPASPSARCLRSRFSASATARSATPAWPRWPPHCASCPGSISSSSATTRSMTPA